MEGLEAFLDTYGVAAASAVMLVKAIGVPLPIPGDVILIATAARAAEGKVLLWLAFAALLLALTLGGTLQFMLARGPARRLVMRYGHRPCATAIVSASPRRASSASQSACGRAASSPSAWRCSRLA